MCIEYFFNKKNNQRVVLWHFVLRQLSNSLSSNPIANSKPISPIPIVETETNYKPTKKTNQSEETNPSENSKQSEESTISDSNDTNLTTEKSKTA